MRVATRADSPPHYQHPHQIITHLCSELNATETMFQVLPLTIR
jgi:hypothetical protein